MRRLSIPSLVLLVSALLAGCASSSGSRREYPPLEESDVSPEASAPTAAAPAQQQPQATQPPQASFNPKTYVAAFPRAHECEQAARKLKEKSADAAWAVLRACVERGGFTLIQRLTDGTWDQDLQTRPEASVLLARVIADRGGDVDGDLGMLVQRRIPLFSLGAAITQPNTYKGRLVLMRAKVSELKDHGGKPTVMLAEMGLGSRTQDVEVGPAYNSTYSNSGSFNASAKTTNFGSGSLKANSSNSSSYRSAKTVQLHENTVAETGVQALGRLTKADPFLAPNRQFVILARFDGVRPGTAQPTDEGEPDPMAVLSIVSYYEPAALLIE